MSARNEDSGSQYHTLEYIDRTGIMETAGLGVIYQLAERCVNRM